MLSKREEEEKKQIDPTAGKVSIFVNSCVFAIVNKETPPARIFL